MAAPARALSLLPLSFLGWGVPSRPPAPRGLPAGTALSPPRAAQLPAVSHPTPTPTRSDRAPRALGTNSRGAPQPAPRLPSAGASPPAPGGRLISRVGWWGHREGSPLGKGDSDPAPRDREGWVSAGDPVAGLSSSSERARSGPLPCGGWTLIHPSSVGQRGGGEALAWQGEPEVTGQVAASI